MLHIIHRQQHKENQGLHEEIRVLRAEAQRRRRNFKTTIASEVDKLVSTKLKAKVEKFVVTKMDKIVTIKVKKLLKPVAKAVDQVQDLDQQIEDLKAEMSDKFDEEQIR